MRILRIRNPNTVLKNDVNLVPAKSIINNRVGKNPGLKKKNSLVGFLVFFLFLFFFFFLGGFLGFFGFFCPEERVLGLFSVSRILLGASRLQIIITLTN